MQKYVQKPAQENNRCRTVELWGWIVINPVSGQSYSTLDKFDHFVICNLMHII